MVLGATQFGDGGEKSHVGTGSERQELDPRFALLALSELWVKPQWESGAETALERTGRAAYGGEKKIPKAAGGA